MKLKKMRSTQSSHDDNDTSQSRDHIPPDIIFEILSRLPAKSVVRSRSVSKLWSSLTTTPDFINSFASQSSRRPRVLLIFSKRDELFVFSPPLHQDTYPQAEPYHFTIPNNGFLRRYDSVHGLIYLEYTSLPMIWNPTMNRFFKLPIPQGIEGNKYTTGYLGYDPIDRKHKVLCILTADKFGILTLGDQESWRILSEDVPMHWYSPGCSVLCINGVIYYEGIFGMNRQNFAIMSFDLRSEKFRLIRKPGDDIRGSFFISYEGRLALIIGSNGRAAIKLWILEDAENHQWVRKHFPSHSRPSTAWIVRNMMLKGVTDAGEFIYIYRPMDLDIIKRNKYDWFDIVYFDPKKNSKREVKIQGMAFDDFERLCVDGYDLIKGLSVVPNHIESLMSL